MFACNRNRVAVFVALVLALPFGTQAAEETVPNAGRLALLENETARFASIPVNPVSGGIPMEVVVALVAGLSASFLGTYFGMRRFAFGRLVERDGWREVTYRVRSTPLSIQSGTLGRMSKVLEDLERLSAEMPFAGGRVPATAVRAQDSAPSAEPARIVTFARRENASPEPIRIAPAPVAAPASLPAFVPSPPPVSDRYRRARTLFAEGFDLSTVQAMTGLKRAELDLVRGTPQPAPRPA